MRHNLAFECRSQAIPTESYTQKIRHYGRVILGKWATRVHPSSSTKEPDETSTRLWLRCQKRGYSHDVRTPNLLPNQLIRGHVFASLPSFVPISTPPWWQSGGAYEKPCMVSTHRNRVSS